MSKTANLLRGAALGAGLMYLFDPDRGRRRRAMLRDRLVRAGNDTEEFLQTAVRDLKNRATGMAAEARSMLDKSPVSDEILVERVRAKLGRCCSHPRAVHVTAEGGRITLSGPILQEELKCVLDAASSVRGVRGVENRLEPHESPGDISSLQGGVSRPGEKPELLQTNWAPGPRLLACLTGCMLAAYGAKRGGIAGAAASVTGVGLMARSMTNMELGRIAGANGRRSVDLQKTINIGAPLEQVYMFFSDYENFPRFMRHVREVRDLGNGRSHWVVDGPAGRRVEWDAELTRMMPHEEIAWKTVEGQPVQHAGMIRFRPNAEGGTQVNIQMTYNPPAGALGHLIAHALGADPKREMDEDLARMKTFLETGNAPHDAAIRAA